MGLMPVKQHGELQEPFEDTLVRLKLIAYNRRLVDARKAKGWTQAFVAQMIGLQPQYISPVETLKVVPSPDVMQDFADLYELPVEYLFPPSLMATLERGAFQRRVMELGEPQLYKLGPEQYRLLLPEPSMPQTEKDDLAKQIDDVLSTTLTPRERRVLQLRFGLEDGHSRTQEEIGKEFGVTKERIHQVEAKALRKLRHPKRSRKLKDYLD